MPQHVKGGSDLQQSPGSVAALLQLVGLLMGQAHVLQGDSSLCHSEFASAEPRFDWPESRRTRQKEEEIGARRRSPGIGCIFSSGTCDYRGQPVSWRRCVHSCTHRHEPWSMPSLVAVSCGRCHPHPQPNQLQGRRNRILTRSCPRACA